MRMRMRIAVGIATVGRPAILAETLHELTRQTRQPDRIVVCGTRESDIGDRAGWTWPAEAVLAPRGLPHQRNRILDVTADCQVLLFLDDDFLPDSRYLEVVEELFTRRPDLVMATGRVLADGICGPGLAPAEGRAILAADRYAGERLAASPTFSGYGCNMALRCDVAQRHRLRFDERLPLYAWQEDVDFSRRVAAHGTILLAEGARGVHLGVKQGRNSGVQLGYSQVANPLYLAGKRAGYPFRRALSHIGCNMVANLLHAPRPEPWVDRRGRLYGNWLALTDLLRGKMQPEAILDFAARGQAGLAPADTAARGALQQALRRLGLRAGHTANVAATPHPDAVPLGHAGLGVGASSISEG